MIVIGRGRNLKTSQEEFLRFGRRALLNQPLASWGKAIWELKQFRKVLIFLL